MKKMICFLILLVSILPSRIKGQEEYRLVDVGSDYQIVGDYDTFQAASKAFDNYADDYTNLAIIQGDEVLKMEYGIIEFKTNDSCTLELSFDTDHDKKEINGCYGIDALYIDTSDDGEMISFLLSGEIGSISKDNVTLRPLETLSVRISAYTVKDGILYHEIKNQLKNDFIYAMVALDEAPDYLADDATYYSYDGHYFYTDFHLLVDDWRKRDYSNAVNRIPYYNYYQYLSHRTLSFYNNQEIVDYFSNELKIDSKLRTYLDMDNNGISDALNESQYYNLLPAFFTYQNIYGANAMMMLALSIQESAYGKSYNAYTKNNLFGHAAFDSSEERDYSRYLNAEKSIYSHAKYYISHIYSSSSYSGSFFGNKNSGMNTNYSLDPYWGEKTASNYYRLDKALGFKDRNVYSIGISEKDFISVYKDKDLNEKYFDTKTSGTFSFILLAKETNSYKIQIEPSSAEDYSYNFHTAVGYIKAEDLDYIINEDKISEKKYVTIHLDFAGGEYNNQNELDLLVVENEIPALPNPGKEGYLFLNYDIDIKEASEGDHYKAIYKQVNDFNVYGLAEFCELGKMVNFNNAYLEIIYSDGQKELISMTSDMIGNYDSGSLGRKNISIIFAGIKKEYPLTIISGSEQKKDSTKAKIDALLAKNERSENISDDELLTLKRYLIESDYHLNNQEIRTLDRIYLSNSRNKVNYVIDDNLNLSLSISGMALTTYQEEANSNSFLRPIYKISEYEIKTTHRNRMISIGEKYGYFAIKSFGLKLTRNGEPINFSLPVLVQISTLSSSVNNVYTIFYIDDNNNVYELPTERTASYIQFRAPNTGSFMIMAKNSVDTYDFSDQLENLNENNSDHDNQKIYFYIVFLTFFIILDILLIVLKYRLLINKYYYMASIFKEVSKEGSI